MPEFPTVTLLESFERTEAPLSNGGKWTILPLTGVTTIGECEGSRYGWVASATHSGAYWNGASIPEPALEISIEAENATNDWVALWLCFDPEHKNGYRIRQKCIGSEKYEIFLEKCVEGTFSTLATYNVEGIKAAKKVLLGGSVSKGKVAVWFHKFAGEWEVLGEVADSTYTTGKVGIEGEGAKKFGGTKMDAGEQKEESAPTIENPGNQTSHVGTPTSLSVTAVGAEEFKATGLPAGLAINEATGKVTGTPTTIEEPTVTVTVKNTHGENHVEFKWKIEASEAIPNRSAMML